MARHRAVRTINPYDEYDEGDVYGRSVEEEMAFSPSTAGFIYRRGNDSSQATLGAFLASKEEEEASREQEMATHAAASCDDSSDLSTGMIEEPQPPDLSRLSLGDRVLLHSAMDHIRGALGDNFSEPTAEHLLIVNKFDGECVLDMLLSGNCVVPPAPVATVASSSYQMSTASPSAVPRISSTVSPRQPALVTTSPAAATTSPAVVTTLPALLTTSPRPATCSPTQSGASSKAGSLTASPYHSRSDIRSASPHVHSLEDASEEPLSSRRSKNAIDIVAEYAKRQAGKELINMVVVGHVDAGKSTLMGHVLVQLGNVGKRMMHKYESESKKVGKGSFAFAWVLDETGEERSRGITMDVGVTQFETASKLVTLLDAPGHRDFMPNTITGAAQADVALLVIDASPGGFESGFEAGGQTREHSLLLKSLGAQQVAVVVNKLDMVDWSSDRFNEIVAKVKKFLRHAGFKESDVLYIPCSGLLGENLGKRSSCSQLTSWYGGPCLVEAINSFKITERAITKPFRLFISDIFKGMGAGFCVAGKIESGAIRTSDRVHIMPASESALCKAISLHDEPVQWACAGDYATITLTGADMTDITVGMVLCNPSHPVPVTTRFRARIVVFQIDVPITLGYQVMLHYQTVSEPAILKRLVSILDKSGEVLKKKPRCLPKGCNAIVEIQTNRPVCIEAFKDDYKQLSRFMLRSGNATVAAGLVMEIL